MLGPVQHQEQIQPESHRAKVAAEPADGPRLDDALRLRQAHVFPLLVQFGVARVSGALREALAANVTLVRLLARVRPDVFDQDGLQPERLVTIATHKRFFASMLV